MSTIITLDSIRESAEERYGSKVIDLGADGEVELLNPLRLKKTARDTLTNLQESLGGDDVDQEAVISDALRLVAKTPTQGDKLIDAIDGDLAVLVATFEAYAKSTQSGEASASES